MKRKIISDQFIEQLDSLVLNMKAPMKGYFGGNHRTNSYGSTVEFADFREYVLGDDLRRIDWNLYSRFEKHFIKLFVDERQMHIQIFVDCSSSMGFENSKKAESALKIAAALGYISIHNMDKLSYKLIHGDTTDDESGMINGKDAYYRSLDVLENSKFIGEADIQKAVTGCINPGYNDGLTVIISDFLTDSNWKAAIDFLLYRHREVMVVQVLSPEEVAPSYNGRMVLLDAESIDKADEKNLKLRISRSEFEAYKEALSDYLQEVKDFCSSRGVSYMLANTEKDVEKLLLERLFEMGVIK